MWGVYRGAGYDCAAALHMRNGVFGEEEEEEEEEEAVDVCCEGVEPLVSVSLRYSRYSSFDEE